MVGAAVHEARLACHAAGKASDATYVQKGEFPAVQGKDVLSRNCAYSTGSTSVLPSRDLVPGTRLPVTGLVAIVLRMSTRAWIPVQVVCCGMSLGLVGLGCSGSKNDGPANLADAAGSTSVLDAQVKDVSIQEPPRLDSDPRDTRPNETSSVVPTSGAWRSRGIGGGGAFFVPEIGPADEQLYMSTDMGSVFHSGDLGAHWTALDFRNLTGGNYAQVRFTADPRILYAIAPVQEVYVPFVSRDGGMTFERLDGGDATELYYLEVDPNRTDRLLVASWSSLYFSGDSGATFHAVYQASDAKGAGLILAGAFWDDTNIYVGTNDGVLLSVDGGKSFTAQAIAGIAAGQSIVSFAGARQGATTRFFAVTASDVWGGISGCEIEGEGVYRYDVGQTAWTSLASKLPSGHAPVFVAMAVSDPNTAYLAGTSSDAGAPAVAKTSDGGGTFTEVLQTSGNKNVATGWSGSGGDKDWGYGECAEGFAVSKRDANKAAITDMGFVHVTSDGGKSWRQAYLDGADQNAAGAATPKGRAYRGVGAENTSVWWLTWPDATTIFASFTDITSLRSLDSGGSWSNDSRNGLTQNTTYQALLAPSGTMYAPTSPVHDMYMSYRLKDDNLDATSGTVMQSTDKGAHWTLLHDFGHPVVFLALDPNDAKSMYASVVHHTDGGVFRTNNLDQGSAATWTRLPKPPRTEGHPYNLVVLKDGSVVATFSGRRTSSTFTDSAGVFVLPPGASSWTDVSAPAMHYWVKDLVVDTNDVSQSTWYVGVFQAWGVSAAQDSNGLYRTTDRGRTWQRIWSGHNVESVAIDPSHPDGMFVTTEADGLWSTANLSASTPAFVAELDYPFLHPMRVFFNPYAPGEVWVASFGGGLRVRQ
jgi:photosystem II stability/assembly factor-like uncharacterized protein